MTFVSYSQLGPTRCDLFFPNRFEKTDRDTINRTMRPNNATGERENHNNRGKAGGNTGLRLRLITEHGTTTKPLTDAFCKSNPCKEEKHTKTLRPSCSGGELRVLYDALANGRKEGQILTYITYIYKHNNTYCIHSAYLAYITDPKPTRSTGTGIWHVRVCVRVSGADVCRRTRPFCRRSVNVQLVQANPGALGFFHLLRQDVTFTLLFDRTCTRQTVFSVDCGCGGW